MYSDYENEWENELEDDWDADRDDKYGFYEDNYNYGCGHMTSACTYDCEYGEEYLDSRGSEFDGDAEATLLMSYDYDDTHVERFEDDYFLC